MEVLQPSTGLQTCSTYTTLHDYSHYRDYGFRGKVTKFADVGPLGSSTNELVTP